MYSTSSTFYNNNTDDLYEAADPAVARVSWAVCAC